MEKIKSGIVYEIKLDIKKYVYVCRFNEFLLGLFDVISEKQIDIETVKSKKIIDYKDCTYIDKLNRFAREEVKKNTWKKIGEIELVGNNIKIPDLAIYNPWKPELSHKNCEVLRYGCGPIKVTQEEYKKILGTGLIYGCLDNFIIFERYITRNIDNILNNKPMDPDGDVSTFS
jgi:hypothetical protein